MTSASYHRTIHVPVHRRDRQPLIDQAAAGGGNALWLIGRILIGGIFVQSGFAKLMDIDAFAGMLATAGVPAASLLAPVAATVEFIGGLAVVLGVGTRYAALVMAAFVVAATLISHRFWAAPAAQEHAQVIQFTKNVAIFGGFLFLFVTGGGRFSLDRWWCPHRIDIVS
jgi:putative oxidoreductase